MSNRADEKLELIRLWHIQAEKELSNIPIESLANIAQRTMILTKFFSAVGFTVTAHHKSLNTEKSDRE